MYLTRQQKSFKATLGLCATVIQYAKPAKISFSTEA